MNTQSSNLLFILAMLAIFYFLILRPQQKRAKAQRELLDALSVGDEVVTIGGLYGRVISVDERVRIEVGGGAWIDVARQAVASIVSSAESGPDGDDDAPENGDTDGPGVGPDASGVGESTEAQE